MNENKEFRPYVPADKITPEMTVVSILTGIILAVVFGATNAYLGLRVGMTVSASIPAAVISMGVIRIIMRRNSILESNMVQTVGSAGESLAVGAIFTLPALFLWAAEGNIDCITGRIAWSFFYGSSQKCIDCERTWHFTLSGRNSMCRGTFGR